MFTLAKRSPISATAESLFTNAAYTCTDYLRHVHVDMRRLWMENTDTRRQMAKQYGIHVDEFKS